MGVIMKSIMMSIKPKWAAKILNREKTIEVRKQFPFDYVGWVYIYCTKEETHWKYPYVNEKSVRSELGNCSWWAEYGEDSIAINERTIFEYKAFKCRGKVVARFWCDKVEDYGNGCLWRNKNKSYSDYEKILKPSCLTDDELYDYCEDLCFYAIYITKLEIFETPRDISEFKHEVHIRDNVRGWYYDIATLKRPPQSWLRIIEGE